MKKMLLLLIIISSIATFAQSGKEICDVYGRKALSCYQDGLLSSEYDETGEGCGQNDNFWEISMSRDESFKAIVAGHFSNTQFSQTMCAITFQKEDKLCSFSMNLSLTQEDADVMVSEVSCR